MVKSQANTPMNSGVCARFAKGTDQDVPLLCRFCPPAFVPFDFVRFPRFFPVRQYKVDALISTVSAMRRRKTGNSAWLRVLQELRLPGTGGTSTKAVLC